MSRVLLEKLTNYLYLIFELVTKGEMNSDNIIYGGDDDGGGGGYALG